MMKRMMVFENCRKIWLGILIIVVSLGIMNRESCAQSSDFTDYQRALRVISEKVHDRYPYLEGEIVAVKGADIYLSIGQKDKASKGVKLTVLRKGAPFKHPVTGVVLGTLEEEIGEAEIIDVREKYSVARMTKLVIGKDLIPQVRDIVRLSSSKVRLSVLPFVNKTKEAFSTEILTRDLARALLSKGRFDVYDVDQLQVWLLDNAIAVDEILKGENVTKLKNQIKRDLVLINEIREVKGKKFLSSRLLELSTRKEIFKAVAIADELPFEQRAPREQALNRGGSGGKGVRGVPNQSFVSSQTGIPGARGKASNFLFKGQEFRGVSISDINKDGQNELVIITSHQVIAYQIKENRMREVARFDEGVGNNFQWIDVGDMNGNGRPEVYIANFRGNDLLSMVLEMKGSRFEKLVYNRRTFFRLIQTRRAPRKVKLPDRESHVLLGQYQGTDNVLEGPIYRYRWAGKELKQVAPYRVPEKFEIVGFTLWDLEGNGSPAIVELGKDDYIRIYSRHGEERHKTAARYGAPVNVVHEDSGALPISEEFDVARLAIRPRLLVADINGDGIEQLLTVANDYSATRLMPGLGISSGGLVSLVWDGTGLSEIWRSPKLTGGVTDFAYGDADNDGTNDLVVIAVGADALSASSKSTIYIYKLAE